MKKNCIIGFIMAAVFMIAIGVPVWADEQAEAYVPMYRLADQGGQDCPGATSPEECIWLKAERARQAAAKQRAAQVAASVAAGPCGSNPCLNKIDQTTTAILDWTERSGGEPTPEEMGTDEQTLQQKARKNLKLTKEIHKSVGKAKPKAGMPELSLHEKLGEQEKPGETVLGYQRVADEKLTQLTKQRHPKHLASGATGVTGGSGLS